MLMDAAIPSNPQYVSFLRKMKQLAAHLTPPGATLGDSAKIALKVLDEYNYAKYTKQWT